MKKNIIGANEKSHGMQRCQLRMVNLSKIPPLYSLVSMTTVKVDEP